MKFSVAVTTLLPLFVAFPPNVSARLASKSAHDDHDHANGNAKMDENNDENNQNDARYLTWDKDTSLDATMKAKLANCRELNAMTWLIFC